MYIHTEWNLSFKLESFRRHASVDYWTGNEIHTWKLVAGIAASVEVLGISRTPHIAIQLPYNFLVIITWNQKHKYND